MEENYTDTTKAAGSVPEALEVNGKKKGIRLRIIYTIWTGIVVILFVVAVGLSAKEKSIRDAWEEENNAAIGTVATEEALE